MIGTMGWQQLLLILVILALLFGARRVSDLGGALGRGIREFRQEAREPGAEGDDEKGSTDVVSAEAEEKSEEPRT
jgi:sec-independent protein translocase protein TatA